MLNKFEISSIISRFNQSRVLTNCELKPLGLLNGQIGPVADFQRRQYIVSQNSLVGWLVGWLGFNGILSTQVAAISCLRKFNGMYKRDYTFRMNVMEEIFEIRSCIEILANDIKVNTADEYMLYS